MLMQPFLDIIPESFRTQIHRAYKPDFFAFLPDTLSQHFRLCHKGLCLPHGGRVFLVPVFYPEHQRMNPLGIRSLCQNIQLAHAGPGQLDVIINPHPVEPAPTAGREHVLHLLRMLLNRHRPQSLSEIFYGSASLSAPVQLTVDSEFEHPPFKFVERTPQRAFVVLQLPYPGSQF